MTLSLLNPTFSRTPASTMVPSSFDSSYLRNSTLSNSRFVLGPQVAVDLVEEVDPSGTWHIHVVKIEAGKRSHVLTGTAGDLQEALKDLHVKSAQEVHQYKAANGFKLPPVIIPSSRLSSLRGGVDGRRPRSQVIALCGSSSEDEEQEASDSDDSLDGRPNRRGRRQGRNRRVVAVEAVSNKCSRSDDEDNSDANMSESADNRSPSRRKGLPKGRVPLPGPSQPRPPPGWNNVYFAGQPPIPSGLPVRPPPPPPGTTPIPPLRPVSLTPPIIPTPLSPQRCVPALLNITWIGRGRKNMLAQVVPTEHALRQMAVMEARLRPGSFVCTQAPSNIPPPPSFSLPNSLSFRAVIRRVTLGGDVYEVSSFGNDLTSLFRSSSDIPRFDIEVVGVLIPPPPRPRANSMSSVNSDDDIVDP